MPRRIWIITKTSQPPLAGMKRQRCSISEITGSMKRGYSLIILKEAYEITFCTPTIYFFNNTGNTVLTFQSVERTITVRSSRRKRKSGFIRKRTAEIRRSVILFGQRKKINVSQRFGYATTSKRAI